MRKSRKDNLVLAATILFSQKGVAATSIREISSQAGLTEGAIYRHFRSKEELCWYAYEQIVDEMTREKEHLVDADDPFDQKLHEWVRLSYAYYDRAPEAFTYVLLLPEEMVVLKKGVTTRQGDLFMQMFRSARALGMVRNISAAVALSHHSGLMLNIPRLINEQRLSGPALSYVDEVTHAIWLTLKQTDESSNK